MITDITEVYAKGISYTALYGNIEGWLSEPEGFLLYVYGRNCDPNYEIVEIGSFKGKSTCWLGAAVRDTNRARKVIAIDWHKGSKEFTAGTRYSSGGMFSGDTFGDFKKTMERYEMEDYVEAWVMKSQEAITKWMPEAKPIGLLFIDGEHTYESARRDFEQWSPFVIEGGTIMMHDINWEGPKAVWEEFVINSGKYKYFQMDTMGIATKIR